MDGPKALPCPDTKVNRGERMTWFGKEKVESIGGPGLMCVNMPNLSWGTEKMKDNPVIHFNPEVRHNFPVQDLARPDEKTDGTQQA